MRDQELHHKNSHAELSTISAAVEALALDGSIEARGAIFTRREVVDFLLDLTGYTADKKLQKLRLLEPSFGDGDFLIPAIERLIDAWKSSRKKSEPVKALSGAIRAVELHRDTFEGTKGRVIRVLTSHGISNRAAITLAETWLINGDFLLVDLPKEFDTVIGNPPYVRQELIPDVLLTEYRNRYTTIYDRADLYIPFIERSLRSLKEGGSLGFICANRWMKNRYGAPLRKLIAENFHLKIYVDMVDTLAFHSNVIAYPAITVIDRDPPGITRIAHRPIIEASALRALSNKLLSKVAPHKCNSILTLEKVAHDSEPWILESSDRLAVVRRLEATFPLLEDAGCKVGIGVATGADKAFIGPFEELDVEDDRKLPLVMTRDIQEGVVNWRGLGVINPFSDETGLVDLKKYPRLKRYLEAHKKQIAGRHCAKKTPINWYRTIDRIKPSLAKKPKLLIPDIKGKAHIVYEGGQLYPHHNLYYITSDVWDLKALQAVLLSSLARFFIAAYSTRMRGGFLRFQAQYLRRLRLPLWKDVPKKIRRDLINAAEKLDIAACDQATFALYGLSSTEKATLSKNGA